ncbi:MAG TPA: alpha-hydroxy acid oxidase [Pseudonocardiaceae bacterium]|jgi:4-hydroxymandelate oxidase|nr:alpha-hydroxy acid oxidase [Pseudonocardiaceae bacterium]
MSDVRPDPGTAQRLLTVADYQARAKQLVEPVYYDYFAGAARDEITMRANESAFRELCLLPRVLRGSDKRRFDVSLLGTDAGMPILLSPTAFHKIAHPDGELATARAAAAMDSIMIVSMASTVAVEDIAAAARAEVPGRDPALWFQLYLQPDRDFTEAIVRRGEAAGVRALVVTVDSPVLGHRERDDANEFHDLPAGMCCENLRDLRPGSTGHVRQIAMSAELSWADLDWLRGITALPILLKGVLHPEDARLAVGHGVDGLLVSNHGGRQLDTVPATITALPEIIDAVGGRIPVILDGGIRRGTDVIKALALGASAVGIGRPAIWGLAVDGENGVRAVLGLLREEFDHALALCGAASLADLNPDLVRRY